MFSLQRLSIVLLIAFNTPLTSLSAQPSIKADALFDAAAKAIGFEDALISIGSIEAHAHVTVGERTYDTVVKSAFSAKEIGNTIFTIIRNGSPTTYSDTDGQLTATTGDGVPKPLPAAMRSFVHGHQFHRLILFPKLAQASFELGPADLVENSLPAFAGPCSRSVIGKMADGSDLTYYFDRSSNRMTGFQLTIYEEGVPRPMSFALKDWRTKGGQTLFWRLEISDKDDLYTYEFNKILLLP